MASKTVNSTNAPIFVEMQGQQVDIKDIRAKVKEVKGTQAAYLNPSEGIVYCVNKDNETTAVALV